MTTPRQLLILLLAAAMSACGPNEAKYPLDCFVIRGDVAEIRRLRSDVVASLQQLGYEVESDIRFGVHVVGHPVMGTHVSKKYGDIWTTYPGGKDESGALRQLLVGRKLKVECKDVDGLTPPVIYQ